MSTETARELSAEQRALALEILPIATAGALEALRVGYPRLTEPALAQLSKLVSDATVGAVVTYELDRLRASAADLGRLCVAELLGPPDVPGWALSLALQSAAEWMGTHRSEWECPGGADAAYSACRSALEPAIAELVTAGENMRHVDAEDLQVTAAALGAAVAARLFSKHQTLH